jgi:hypothetical protein
VVGVGIEFVLHDGERGGGVAGADEAGAAPAQGGGDLEGDAGERLASGVGEGEAGAGVDAGGRGVEAEVEVEGGDADGGAIGVGELGLGVGFGGLGLSVEAFRFGGWRFGGRGGIAVALEEDLAAGWGRTVGRLVGGGLRGGRRGLLAGRGCGLVRTDGVEPPTYGIVAKCSSVGGGGEERDGSQEKAAFSTTVRRFHDPKPLRGLWGLDSGGGGRTAERRWRRASYMTTAPATETLSEETLPAMGMRRRKSQVRLTRSWRPAPSRPRTRQMSWARLKSV